MVIHCVIVTLKMQMIGIRDGGPIPDWWLQQSPINYSAPWQRMSRHTVALLFGLQCGCCSKIYKIGIEVDQWINIRNIWTNLIEPGNFQKDKNIEYLKVIEGGK